jgi:2-phosphoglycerate kinase
VEALLVIDDEELHRGHFSHRRGARPPERYLARFGDIRTLQEHLAACARDEGVAVIENDNVDDTLGHLMDLVLDAAAEVT